MTADNDRRLLSVADVAGLGGVSQATVYRWIKSEGLPVIRVDRTSMRISVTTFNKWFAAHQPGASIEPIAPPELPAKRLAYTIEEALEAVPIGRTKMFELMASGRLRTVTLGRRRLIPADALAALMAGNA